MTMPDTPLTLRGAVKLVGEKLAIAGIEQPSAEARRLIVEALEIDSVELIRNLEKVLSTSQVDAVQHWLKRRSCGEPLARIRGWQEFYGRRFELTEATLEPRADTETLIDAVLAKADESHGRSYPWRILDVGTGTGCIAITLLAELPQARAVATDISAQAIHTAKTNAQSHGVEARFQSCATDLADGLTMDFDVVVSNPPYIRSEEIPALQTEVKAFDPLLALDGGSSGLSCYCKLSSQLARSAWVGHLFVEIAANDHGRVVEAFDQEGLKFKREGAKLWRDLTGHVRCVAIETLP